MSKNKSLKFLQSWRPARLLAAACLLLLSFAFASSAWSTPAPGPDGGGYSSTAITNDLRNINGTTVSLSDDQVSGAISIPFTFDFYGKSYNSLHISSNGFIQFDGANNLHQGCCSGRAIPAADGIDNIIAMLWDDLNPASYGGGQIRYQVLGSAPNREFVVGFYGVPLFYNNGSNTVEAILHEGSNDIELQYGAVIFDGSAQTVGTENETGTEGLQIAAGGNANMSNLGFMVSTSYVAPPPPPPSGPAIGGPMVLSGDDADDGGHCGGSACGQLYGKALSFVVNNSQSSGTGIVAVGVNSSYALSSFNSWNQVSNAGPNVAVTHVRTTSEIANVNFSNFAAIYIASDSRNTSGGMTSSQLTALNARQADIVTFVNNLGGGLLALSESGYSHKYNWLPLSLTTANSGHSNSSGNLPTADMSSIAPGITESHLSHCCYHTVFTGPPGFSGLRVLAYHDHNNNDAFDGASVDQVLLLGGTQVTIQGNLGLTPVAAIDEEVGDSHTVTASAEDGSPLGPVAGATVTFNISAGPNAGASGTCNPAGCVTDSNGEVTFTYVGSGGVGTDSIVASFVDSNNVSQTSNTATATWVISNQPPTADAGSTQIVEQTGPSGSSVTLDGSGSSDPDNDPLTYSWTGVFGTASGATPSVSIPAGTYTVTLVVNDGTVDSTPATMSVTVVDTTAPAITAPDDVQVEATGPQTDVTIGTATANDAVGVTSIDSDAPADYSVTTTVVIWTACDAAGNCASDTQNVTVVDTTAPSITAPDDVTVEATGPQTDVTIGTATATDAVGVDSITSDQPADYTASTTTVVTWTACDAAGNCNSATQNVTVVDTTPPAVTAPANVTVEATGVTTPVGLGTASATDLVDGSLVPAADNTGPFALGTYTITWSSTDAAGNTGTATQTVTVVDTTAPDISNACLTDKLWPPNHKLVLVSTGSVSDIADPNATFSVSVTSNQPINGTGDGNTDPDWVVSDNATSYEVSLRAERAGNLGQRDYGIVITATDASGNESTAACSASVPHDQGNNTSPATKKGKK